MKTVGMNKEIFVLLAIAVLFSTVAPVSASAQETSFITNVVFTQNSSGGKISVGADGQDGQDGKAGEDGKSGAHGTSVINSNGGASAQIESIVNGIKVLDIAEERSLQDDATSSEVFATSSSRVEINGDLINTEDHTSSPSALFALQEALLSLQLMFAKYVSVLF